MAEHQSNSTFNEFAKNNFEELLSFNLAVQNYFEYGKRNEDGQIIEDLITQHNPLLISAIDYFMIADQEVHLIENFFDENNQPADRVRKIVKFYSIPFERIPTLLPSLRSIFSIPPA